MTSSTTFTYDGDGNRLTKVTTVGTTVSTTTYTWNDDRRLSSVALPSGTTYNFTYNADGLRFTKSIGSAMTKYVWNGQTATAETDGSNALKTTYASSPLGFGDLLSRRDQGTGDRNYLPSDAQGSVGILVKQDKSTVQQTVTDPFGKVMYSVPGTTPPALAYLASQGEQATVFWEEIAHQGRVVGSYRWSEYLNFRTDLGRFLEEWQAMGTATGTWQENLSLGYQYARGYSKINQGKALAEALGVIILPPAALAAEYLWIHHRRQ